jgi:hypothetical protein
MAASTTTARRFRWTSRWAITCSSGSTRARRSHAERMSQGRKLSRLVSHSPAVSGTPGCP